MESTQREEFPYHHCLEDPALVFHSKILPCADVFVVFDKFSHSLTHISVGHHRIRTMFLVPVRFKDIATTRCKLALVQPFDFVKKFGREWIRVRWYFSRSVTLKVPEIFDFARHFFFFFTSAEVSMLNRCGRRKGKQASKCSAGFRSLGLHHCDICFSFSSAIDHLLKLAWCPYLLL